MTGRPEIFSRCFLASMLLVLVLIMLENLFGGMLLRYSRTAETGVFFLNQFNRPLSILSVLIWPVVVILARQALGASDSSNRYLSGVPAVFY